MKWRGISEAEHELSLLNLTEQLLEIKARTRELVRPENLQIQERSIRDLEDSGVAEKILPAGSEAPEFELADSNGKPVRSADLLTQSPLVVLFFRGRWCPFCVATLETWQRLLPELRRHRQLGGGISRLREHGACQDLLGDSTQASTVPVTESEHAANGTARCSRVPILTQVASRGSRCLTGSEREVLRATANRPVRCRRAFMPSRTRVRSLSA